MSSSHRHGPRHRPSGRRAVLALIGLLTAVLIGLGVLPDASIAGTAHTRVIGPIPTVPAPARHGAAVDAPPAKAKAPDPAPVAPKATDTDSVLRVRLHWGDTLWALSRSHCTTVDELQELNRLGSSTLIYAGRILLVPDDECPPAAVPAPAPVPASPGTPRQIPHAVERGPVAGTGGGTSGAAQSSSRAAVAVAFAEAQLGVPYLWGGTGNGGYDCSGLVQAAWRAAGVDIPHYTFDQMHVGKWITRGQLQPGDLVFTYGGDHVQMYVGGGRVIEAPYTGATVRYASLPSSAAAYVHIG